MSVLVFGLLLLGGGALYWPHWRAEVRASNERNAAICIKTLCSAEADFRMNDRDGNGVHDFWTGDVAGLYRFGLIPREFAEADLHPLIPLVPSPIPCHGYFIEVLRGDNSSTPPEIYGQDTDQRAGRVHHREKFGFVAHPARPGVSGHRVYIINENNSQWSSTVEERPVPTYWPSDFEARQWNRCSGG